MVPMIMRMWKTGDLPLPGRWLVRDWWSRVMYRRDLMSWLLFGGGVLCLGAGHCCQAHYVLTEARMRPVSGPRWVVCAAYVTGNVTVVGIHVSLVAHTAYMCLAKVPYVSRRPVKCTNRRLMVDMGVAACAHMIVLMALRK
jgi:hypothetical protein